MKRLIDLTITVLIVILGMPVILIGVIAMYIMIGRPIIFTQNRPGLDSKIFKLYKFRSMSSECDEKGTLLPDVKRLKTFGKFIRASSLDELPSLWNVFKGEMSLIGPRPLLVDYLPLYNVEQSRRHNVKPGISGLAQVSGRNAISWEDKFELDVWYVENQSILLDIKIMYLTAVKVLSQKDINQTQDVTMTAFTGTEKKKNK